MNRLTHFALLVMLMFLGIVTTSARGDEGGDVKIKIVVKVPPKTPADTKLYLAGDAKALGEWKVDGVELKKADDGTYAAEVMLPKDKSVEYKITRGSWETVEKNADGSEMNNRSLTPAKDAIVEIEVAAWADQAASGKAAPTETKSTRTGDIRVHEKFHSKALDNDRTLLVYLPPGYDQHPDQRYAVLYMHDGQNLFDAATSFAGEWQADESAEGLIKDRAIPPIIIVGIANNSRRVDEYTMTRDDRRGAGGKGDAYIRFVVEEVKPFIDLTYRTKKDRASTGVAGSSLGGTISLEICRAHPEIFGLCGVISPSLWWNDDELLKRFATDTAWMKQTRFWLDIGTAEGADDGAGESGGRQRAVDDVRKLEAIFTKAGLTAGTDFKVSVVEGGQHNEAAWSKRFDQVLRFLFPL